MRPMSPAGRPSPVQPRPAHAGIGALPQAAARPAAVEAEGGSPPLIGRGVEHVRIRRIDGDVGGTGVVVDLQRARPGRAAVGGPVDAAIAARSPDRSLRGHVGDGRVRRVQRDPADVPAGPQSDVGPGLAGVGALVDAVAPPDALPVRPFPGADPEDGRVGLEQGDVAHRVHRLALEHRLPRDAGVTGAKDRRRWPRPRTSTLGSDSTTSMSTKRPDIVAGPMLRSRSAARSLAASACGRGACAANRASSPGPIMIASHTTAATRRGPIRGRLLSAVNILVVRAG